MAKKKIRQKWYSKERISFDCKLHKHFIEELDNNYLYSNGKYPTKITPEDLPEDFFFGRFYKRWGYLSASGVKDLFYKQSQWSNHLYKDDFLYISYNEPINKTAILNYDYENENHDFLVYGNEILDFIEKMLSLEEYKNTDIYNLALNIQNQLEEKRKKWEEEYDKNK